MKLNKLQASRNAKWDYLLRGIIFCETHHRHYAGQHFDTYWQYRCSGYLQPGHSPCPLPFLNGKEIEEKVKGVCRDILTKPELIEAEIADCTGPTQETLESIDRKLAALDAKEARALNTETNLVVARASGDASAEAYERALTRVGAQRLWVTEERQRLKAQREAVQKREGVLLGLRETREKLLGYLERGNVGDWREIINALGVKVSVGEDGVVHVSLALPVAKRSIVCNTGSYGSGT